MGVYNDAESKKDASKKRVAGPNDAASKTDAPDLTHRHFETPFIIELDMGRWREHPEQSGAPCGLRADLSLSCRLRSCMSCLLWWR